MKGFFNKLFKRGSRVQEASKENVFRKKLGILCEYYKVIKRKMSICKDRYYNFVGLAHHSNELVHFIKEDQGSPDIKKHIEEFSKRKKYNVHWAPGTSPDTLILRVDIYGEFGIEILIDSKSVSPITEKSRATVYFQREGMEYRGDLFSLIKEMQKLAHRCYKLYEEYVGPNDLFAGS